MIGSGAHKNIRGTVMAACIIIIIIVMEIMRRMGIPLTAGGMASSITRSLRVCSQLEG